MSNFLARLLAVERRREPSGPWVVQVIVHHDGTSVGVHYATGGRPDERLTLGEYRTRFGEELRHLERWIIAADAEPIADRMCEHW